MKSEEIDVHNRTQKYQHSLQALQQSGISQNNKETIMLFLKEVERKDGLGIGRLEKNTRTLMAIAEMLGKDFKKATQKDIEKIIDTINNHKKRNGQGLSEWTKCDYRIILKRFYRWIYGNKRGKYPELVEDLRTSFKKAQRLPEEMLNESDIEKMINATQNPRERAFIMTLFDGGLRISEALNLRIKHLTINGDEASLIIPFSKTESRRILLIPAVPYLATWLSYHPHKDNPDALLFESPRNNGRIISYTAASKSLVTIAKKVGITKPVNCHAFRHASATYYARLGLSHSQLCVRYGWQMSSKMPNIYIHLSGQDLDYATRKAHGKITEGKKEEKLKSKGCAYCGHLNEGTNDNCAKCGTTLDVRTAIQMKKKRELFDTIVEKLLEDPKIKEKALEIMGQLKK